MTLRTCDLRLGDQITAVVHGVEVTGTCVHVGALFAMLMGTGYTTPPGQARPVPDPEGRGVVYVGKHSEITEVRAPQNQAELEEWLDRPLIVCQRCEP